MEGRIFARGGEREVRFMYRDPRRTLPIISGGRLTFVRWGTRDRKSRLPPTGWTWLDTVESGKWNAVEPELVVIPANLAFEKGVWFRVRQGIRGLLVNDEDGTPTVYMLCEPPTRYYQVMTRSDRMPCLVDEII